MRSLLSAALAAFLVLGGQVAANAQALTDDPNSITSCSWTPPTGTIEYGGTFNTTVRFNGTPDGDGRVKYYVEVDDPSAVIGSGSFSDLVTFDTPNTDIAETKSTIEELTKTAVRTEIYYSVRQDGSKGDEMCRLTLTFLPEGGGTDDEEPTDSPIAPTQSPLALSCSPDPVVAGGVVTCLITGGDPNVDILWRASYNPVFASQGVKLDAEGNGSFSFVAPAAALGLPVTVELVEWDRTAVVTVGRPLPTSVPAGEGQGALPLGLTLGGLLVLAGALRLRLHRAGSVA